ncbi:hypothetical protein [Hafnia paralvei]|uniref:hypothetical protein n=1 Tax=Hafnia paralvei TaxID=546367 RepID=UPI001CCE0998|nr:hypothetical protein [Hafnia paralvei]UBM39759.1 hypothetical protein K9N75_15485 [Hafnia paralvei]
MTKLTTEVLKEIIGSYPEDSDEIECVMARQLLAYEQAAEKPYGYLEPYDFPRTTATLYPEKDRYAVMPIYAAPVLPKQPEHSRQHFESLCNQFWNWAELDEIDQDEEPLLEWNGSNYTNRVTAALWKMYQAAPAQPVIPEHCQMTPDEMLCDFYEVSNWPDLVRELVKHVEQLQESAKRNVKPWEDTFPETLLPAYVDRITRANDACRAEMLKNGKSASTELPNHSELSTDSPVIPDGWKLVPIEPTAAMFHAFNDDDYGRKSMRERYIQMIEAAPAQESE